MAVSSELIETLRTAQRLGFFGDRPIEEAVDHSRHFLDAIARIEGSSPPATVLDLGSGGGLPGLVVAAELRSSRVVLVDRREKRTDFLRRAVARLEFDHVEVWSCDASDVRAAVGVGDQPGFDVVTARGFGPPDATLRMAHGCLRRAGSVVISEPPSGDRWPVGLLDELGFRSRRVGAVRLFSAIDG